MKAILNHNKLAQAILYTSRCVSSKPNIPILSNVYISASSEGISLYATNLEISISMWIPGLIEEEGKTTVSAKYLADFLSASKSDKVTLELVGNSLKVTLDKSKATFNTINHEEYPITKDTDKNFIFKIKKQNFISCMDKILFACSTDNSISKIQQTGVFVEALNESRISLVGLDGIRLSLKNCDVTGLNTKNFLQGIIIPAKYISEFIKIVDSDYYQSDEIEFYLSSNNSQVVLKYEDIEFSIRLIDGNYPDYKKILPDSYIYRFIVDKNEIEDAVRVVNTFARGSFAFKTLFDFDSDTGEILMKSSVSEIGENEYFLNVEEPEGDGKLESAYNIKLLQDVISKIKTGKIIFETKGPLAATVIKDQSDDDFLHLLMPLRREE